MNKHPMLTICADHDFLQVVLSFVENTCSGYKLGKRETTALVLAAEEVFAYLSQHNGGTMITLECRPKPYLMEMTLKFNAQTFNVMAFNLTSSVDFKDESSLDKMGLLLASRMVDRFSMNQAGPAIHMSFLKYRNYPEKGVVNYHPAPLDPGSGAWVHPALEKKIRDQYNTLFLPRNILAVAQDMEPSSPHSVISSEMNRSSDSVVMHPLIFGKDTLENLGDHLSLFKSEGYKEISFQLDLGQSDQTGWVPSLIEHDFIPELLLPYGGKGDLLIMTYKSHPKAGI